MSKNKPNKTDLSVYLQHQANLIVLAVSFVIFGGSAFASESFTTNSSEAYVPDGGTKMIDAFVPFVDSGNGFCASGNCSSHGQAAVDAWAAPAIDVVTGDGQLENAYFDGAGSGSIEEDWNEDAPTGVTGFRNRFVVDFNTTHPNDNYTLLGGTHPITGVPYSIGSSQNIFGFGKGMHQEWLNELREFGGFDDCGDGTDPLTTPGRTGLATLDATGTTDSDICTIVDGGSDWAYNGPGTERTELIDQIVLGYIQTGDNFAQNFRDHMTFGSSWDYETGEVFRNDGGTDPFLWHDPTLDDCATDVAECKTLHDSRIEQGDTDMENVGGNAWTDGAGTLNATQISGTKTIRNAFQQATATRSQANTNHAPYTVTPENFTCIDGTMSSTTDGGCIEKWTENIEQNMEGYFYTCINCSVTDENSFSVPDKLLMQSWMNEAPEITSIVHAAGSTQTSRRY